MAYGSGYNAQVIAPPAALLGGVLVVGFLLELIWPIGFVPAGYSLPVGFALIFLALNLEAGAARQLIKIKTTLSLERPATDLATTGIFAWSRNPMYLGMVLLCAGVAILLNSFWTLILTIALAAVLQRGVIAPEEAYLERRFGRRYLDYKVKVRRWI
ncbi:isoprenylcysteine carboxylmethyltransferase family protein [Methylocapsa sp. D3K7]|uniref:methyltransferase family protein n=1 Tax=Methylocapsa sp. D3K7 TaxID=3041435 RepID=UPI00244E6BCE|nr:isoprenylcysteine carboxylmethyltransferase family protein [Methylocapsa sp. D3K7]WGJ14871.1 isoprenylcysteine carboxylmethyltransferase family protein [Methylocapsa sp. D3K7]